MRSLLIGVALLTFATTALAQQHPYFPLRRGATWTYRVPSMGALVIIRKITDATDATHTYTMEETTLAELSMIDKGLYRFQLSAGNLLELAHAPVPTPLVVTSGAHPIVLKENLAKGMRWKGCGTNSGRTADTECEVVGFVTLTVPAGEYKNVAQLLVGKGGFAPSYNYYAPNVGLVKVQDLDQPSPLMELVSFTPGN